MIYSNNLTNRELLLNAMPLFSLSRNQWNIILQYASSQSGELSKALEVMITNQSRLEVIRNYRDYYDDKLDEQVCNESVELN